MAPRAAARLESLGFSEVYEYKAGKSDWMAAGLPTEGTNAQHPRVSQVARKDVPTAGLNERLGNVSARVQAAGWDAVVVVDDDRVVLGLLRSKELTKDPDLRMEQAMRPGPSTFRPDVLITKMAANMEEHKLESSPITTSDGKLVGLLLRSDASRVAGEINEER
jgi:CBS domain-containing protein